MAHRSRWGWHPCDYETFRLLKRLNARCEQAVRDYTAWLRWQRKKPSNRVCRRHVRDEGGNVVATEFVGPRPKPPLDPLFCLRSRTRVFRDESGRPLKQGRWAEGVSFTDRGIRAAYQTARKPAAAPELVRPLGLTAEEIRRLAAEAEER